MSDHPDTNGFPEYEAAIACFSDLQKNLQSNLTQTYEHGQVELLLKKDGNELLFFVRLSLTGFVEMDLRHFAIFRQNCTSKNARGCRCMKSVFQAKKSAH